MSAGTAAPGAGAAAPGTRPAAPGTRTAAVVGAGIGGLTAALALSARGLAVTVLERRTAFSEPGAGIQLSPNASRVLIDLGLGAALRRVASEPERVTIRDARSGTVIGGVALGRAMRERYGAPYWLVHRADLHTILLDAVRSRPEIRLLVGRGLAGLAQDAAGVTLDLETAGGAREQVRADLAVGADGVWSRMRALLGDGRAPRYRGHVAWRATVPRERMPERFRGEETGLWLDRGGHVVHYPLAGGRTFNIVAVERRRSPVEGWSAPGDPAALRAAFRDAHPDLAALLAVPEAWLTWSLFDLPVRRMAHGRAALLGDAAHPVLPFLAQGGALAIEDAAALAGFLDGADLPAALRRYESERLPRARRVQRAARANGFAYHAGPLVALPRRLVFAHLGPEGMTRRYDWLYGWSREGTLAPAAPGG